MKKQHDGASLASELEGSSAFFREPQPAPADPAYAPPVADQLETQPGPAAGRPIDRSSERATDRPVGRSVPKRPTQRRAFEFYRDQLEIFKGWSAVDIAEGGEGNMSVWAREAFDDYIAKCTGGARPTARSAGRSANRRSGEGS